MSDKKPRTISEPVESFPLPETGKPPALFPPFIPDAFTVWSRPPRPAEQSVLTFRPARLTLHPLLAEAPAWASPEEFETLVQDILDHGVKQPGLIDRWCRIVDGRGRWLAALEAEARTGQPVQMPVIHDPEADIDPRRIIVGTLLSRRHQSKGARAYLVWPLIAPAVQGAKEARTAQANASKSRKPIQSVYVAFDGTVTPAEPVSALKTDSVGFQEETLSTFAARYCISADLFDQARRLHTVFTTRKDLRLEYEPQILAGEMGLGACLAGIAGKEATEEKKRADAPHLLLLQRGFRDLKNRFEPGRWQAMPAEDRKAAESAAVDCVLTWPPDVLTRLRAAL